MSTDPLKEKLGAREAHAPNLPFSESSSMNLSEVQTFQKLSVWLRENALPPYKQILVALAAKIEELERVERVRPDDVDEALIWIIGERHHQRVREEMAAYLNDKMAMRALAAHSAAPSDREPLTATNLAKLFHETYERLAPNFGYETRKDSAVPWEQVPERNRLLMIAVCQHILAGQDKPTRAGEPK